MIALLAVAALAADPPLCARLAADIRRDRPSDAASAHLTASVQAAVLPHVRLAHTPGISPTVDTRLRAMFGDLLEGSSVYRVYGQGALWQVSSVQGTLDCQSDGFVRHGADGMLAKLPTPPAYADLCWTSSRAVGTAYGKPALIEQDVQTQPYEGVDVEVTPWRPGWGVPCGLRVRYDDRFVLRQRLCGDDEGVCAAGEAAAVQWSREATRGRTDAQLQAMAATPAAVMAAQAAAFAAASKLIDDLKDAALPTFGAQANTDYPAYSYPTTRLLVVVAGQPLLARIGIGGVGWRAIGDRLVTLYRVAGGTPIPVASYVVRRTITGLRSVATFTPRPYRNVR